MLSYYVTWTNLYFLYDRNLVNLFSMDILICFFSSYKLVVNNYLDTCTPCVAYFLFL
jgi:hypothetical protein